MVTGHKVLIVVLHLLYFVLCASGVKCGIIMHNKVVGSFLMHYTSIQGDQKKVATCLVVIFDHVYGNLITLQICNCKCIFILNGQQF